MDAAGMTVDGLRAQLTAEHFRDGRVPRRTTAAERLAGVNLTEDFVQAVADVCSRDATERERWLKEANALMAGHGVPCPGPGTDPLSPHPAEPSGRAELVEELVQVQRQTLDVHDRLLRAWERAADLERERSNATRMMVVLLTMVDKLHRDTASLTAERDRLRRHERRPDLLEKVRERLARSEIQRKKAEAELERARSERSRADRLAEQAAQQVRTLTEELERLRHQNGQTDNSPFETILTPAPRAGRAPTRTPTTSTRRWPRQPGTWTTGPSASNAWRRTCTRTTCRTILPPARSPRRSSLNRAKPVPLTPRTGRQPNN